MGRITKRRELINGKDGKEEGRKEWEGWLGGGKVGKESNFTYKTDPPHKNIFLQPWAFELLKPRYLKLTISNLQKEFIMNFISTPSALFSLLFI